MRQWWDIGNNSNNSNNNNAIYNVRPQCNGKLESEACAVTRRTQTDCVSGQLTMEMRFKPIIKDVCCSSSYDSDRDFIPNVA